MVGISEASLGYAIADYTEAIRLDPDSGVNCFSRGFAFAQSGKFQSAIADFDQAIRRNSERTEYYFNRGDAFLETEKYDKAIADFNVVAKANTGRRRGPSEARDRLER